MGIKGLTNHGIGGIMHARFAGYKVWKVWDREVWPPGHYEAL